MSRLSIKTLAWAALLAFASPVIAQDTKLAPQRERIADAVIQADHDAYAAIQQRIQALNDGGRRVADYHLAKAQCWLDTSFHEYTRNDRSAYPQEALTESEKLVVAMEQKRSPLPIDTPLVNGASRLRPDLWSRLDAFKAGPGFVCGQQKVACAEVELVHAGNEYDQQGWRHAKPYVQIAEDLVADAETLAQRCAPPSPSPSPSSAAVVAVPLDETIVAHVEFRFDGSGAADIVAASRAQLDALLRRLASGPGEVRSIRLVGHADRLNGTRNARYNQQLSERRAATVRDLLIAHGMPSATIAASAEGERRPIAACPGPYRSKDELETCLRPDRRVDIEVLVTH